MLPVLYNYINNGLTVSNLARKTIYWLPRIIVLVFTVPIFVFALLSGSANYGGGIKGIIMNSPNALPWLVLLGVVYVAWRWEKIGGWLLIALSVIFAFFFDALDNPVVSLVILTPILVSGILFLISGKIKGAGKPTQSL